MKINEEIVLLKLGGSVITFKDKPVSANFNAIDNICKVFKDIELPFILIHGGGSFGHYWSVKYDMHTQPKPYDPHGVAVVHESMVALNQIIVNSMIKNGLNPYSIMPSSFISGNRIIPSKIKELQVISNTNIIPITFGDVVHTGDNKYSIISGDALMTLISKQIRPSRAIFALNVDGIFKDMKNNELLSEIQINNNNEIEFSDVNADVTGGMKRKVSESLKISGLGTDVIMVNGLFPERIVEAFHGKLDRGTIIKARRRKKSA